MNGGLLKDRLKFYDKITSNIRNHFSKIIYEWSESRTKKVYKFEEFDLLKLMGFDEFK
ncbi:MAG: hypothetical protein ACOC2U_01335 [bacterium]